MEEITAAETAGTETGTAEMETEMHEAARRIAKKYASIYEKAFKDARAMKVPAHMEKRKEEVISKQERQFKRLKSFVEEKEK